MFRCRRTIFRGANCTRRLLTYMQILYITSLMVIQYTRSFCFNQNKCMFIILRLFLYNFITLVHVSNLLLLPEPLELNLLDWNSHAIILIQVFSQACYTWQSDSVCLRTKFWAICMHPREREILRLGWAMRAMCVMGNMALNTILVGKFAVSSFSASCCVLCRKGILRYRQHNSSLYTYVKMFNILVVLFSSHYMFRSTKIIIRWCLKHNFTTFKLFKKPSL
jgi:hypothetical protein